MLYFEYQGGTRWLTRWLFCCSPTEIASEGLKGRVFEVNLGDLQNNDEDQVGALSLFL